MCAAQPSVAEGHPPSQTQGPTLVAQHPPHGNRMRGGCWEADGLVPRAQAQKDLVKVCGSAAPQRASCRPDFDSPCPAALTELSDLKRDDTVTRLHALRTEIFLEHDHVSLVPRESCQHGDGWIV